MIDSRAKLREYILADESRYHLRRPRLLAWLLHDEAYYMTKFLRVLRHLEYYTNCRRGVFGNIAYFYYVFRHRQLEWRYGVRIAPNVVGKGVYIPHLAGGGDNQCIRGW